MRKSSENTIGDWRQRIRSGQSLPRGRSLSPGRRPERAVSLAGEGAPTSCARAPLSPLVSFWPGPQAAADSVELVSGEKITGIVRRVNDGKLTIAISHPVAAPAVPAAPEDKLFSAILSDMKKTEKPKPEDLRIVPLSDVVQIKFEAVTDRSQSTRPLIDNDRARNGRPVSASLKLRAGYHRFLLAYWHQSGGAFVRLAQSHIEKDNEDRQRFVRGDMLAHLGAGGRETPSPGLDKEGYRLPETLSKEVVAEAEYSVCRRPDGRPFEKMTDVLAAMSAVGQGTPGPHFDLPVPR